MAIRIYKPTTPGRRNASVNLHAEVTKKKPEKSLLAPLHKKGGRNHQGKITVHGRGGGHKRRYRIVDFRRDKQEVPGKVAAIEYLNFTIGPTNPDSSLTQHPFYLGTQNI